MIVRRIGAIALLVCWGGFAWAELKLPALFSDYMVLQQGVEAPVWGWADAGATVIVAINDQRHEVIAGEDGRWRVNLAALPAGGPHRLIVQSGGEVYTFREVLVGEVWIASGQSNMQWSVSQSGNPEQEIANGDHPRIRLFYVPRVTADAPQSDVDATWTECNSVTVADFSAVAYYFGRYLHESLNVPVGLIHTSWGGTPAESWASRGSLEASEPLKPILARWDDIVKNYPETKAAHDKAMEEHKAAAEKAAAEKQPVPEAPRAPIAPDHPHRASSLYNGMIAPLVPYAFQGAIWYQGESNAGRAYQYRTLFPVMIQDWRQAWGGRAFPFYFVQLANFTARVEDANQGSEWAELREAQTMTLGLENTGMAVIIDIGEAEDIHPKNKQDVGKRLALNALVKTYGKEIPFSGPMYRAMTVEGNTIKLEFDHVQDGLVARGGALKGFAIAGADQKFVWADARIEGGMVIVSAAGVDAPVAVRYGWANNPECTLYNSAGLPGSPFRTDDWAGVTVNNQ